LSRGNFKKNGGNLPTSQPGKFIPFIKNAGKFSGNVAKVSTNKQEQTIGMAVPNQWDPTKTKILKLQVSPGASSVASLV